MNRLIILSLLLTAISNLSYSQYKLDVEILEIRNTRGNIMLQLFDGSEKVVTQEKNPIKITDAYFPFRALNRGSMLYD